MPQYSTALITGSVSGIGLEMARILAGKGIHLYLVDIQQEGLMKVSAEILQSYLVTVKTFCIDLSLPDAADRIFEDCREQHIDIDIFISNAGFFFFSEVAGSDPALAARMIRLHIYTPSMLAIHFAKEMKQRGSGYILMTSSVSAYQDFPGIGFYAASKSYIKRLCMSLRHEMRYYGVHVTVLCPGATATNLYDPNVIDVRKGKQWGIMMDPAKVARAGINGLFKNKAVVMPGFMTKVMTLFAMLLPGFLIYWARVRWRRLF
jgi:short-subunit dehydrogenase